MSEKGVSLAILGVVAVIAVVGLILLFNGATANVVVPGVSKAYGGALRQGESDLRPIGETPLRYTSPVENPDLQQYSQQESYYRASFEFNRDTCPDPVRPVIFSESRAAHPDCVRSQVKTDLFCCPIGGQAGRIAGAYYG